MTDRRPVGRLLIAGAGLLALCASACDSSTSADSPTTPATAPSITWVEVATAAVPEPTTTVAAAESTTVAAPEPTVAPVDGSALLASALSTLSTSYHFTTTVTVDSAVVLQADGDRVDGGVRLALAGDAGLVNYVITPEGSWVMPDGGEWEQLDSAAATSDPIAALVAPSSVAVAASNGPATTLTVTVPAPALGLAAGADVAMIVELADGQLRQVRFDSAVEGKPATVTADLGPVIDASPVVAPI